MAAWSGLGMNFQNNINSSASQYNEAQISSELDINKARGINYIRLVSNLNSSEGITNIRNAALIAKNKGLYVMFGATWYTPTLTSTNWNDYITAVTAEAQWAQDNGMDEFQMGNEMEFYNDGTTLTDIDVRNNLRSLSTDLQLIFTNGPISYSVSQGNQALGWINDADKADIDKLDINVYGQSNDFGNFKSELDAWIAAYPDAEITEWNIDPTWNDIAALSESQQVKEIVRRMDYLKTKVSKAYFFTWRWATTSQFATIQQTTNVYRLWWNVLATNNKRWFFVNFN